VSPCWRCWWRWWRCWLPLAILCGMMPLPSAISMKFLFIVVLLFFIILQIVTVLSISWNCAIIPGSLIISLLKHFCRWNPICMCPRNPSCHLFSYRYWVSPLVLWQNKFSIHWILYEIWPPPNCQELIKFSENVMFCWSILYKVAVEDLWTSVAVGVLQTCLNFGFGVLLPFGVFSVP
jgi:hypothetical protein